MIELINMSSVHYAAPKKDRGESSKFYIEAGGDEHFTREDKARISETAGRSDGRGKTRKYHDHEVDFFILYDFTTDTCYVFSKDEVKTAISIREDAAERWDKVRQHIESN